MRSTVPPSSYRWPILWQDLAVCARAGTVRCMPQPTSTKPASAVRAVRLEHDANPGKVQELINLLPVWRAALTACQHDKIRDLKSGGRLRRLLRAEWDLFQPDRFGLSTRQMKSVENQVNQSLASWQAAAVIEGRRLIGQDRAAGLLTDEEAHEMYSLNLRKKWWSNPEGRALVKRILRTHPWPTFGSTSTMVFDDIIAPIEESKSADHPTWWRPRVLDGGILDIPVHPSPYFTARMAEGKPGSVTQVTITDANEVILRRVVHLEGAPPRTEGEVVGLDWGLGSLFATSEGQLLGRNLYEWLKGADQELAELGAALQRQGKRLGSSKRHRKLTHRVAEHVRNEVGRVLNRLAEQDIRELVVENLDFRGGGLSRTLNRIVGRAGRGAVREKLADLRELAGVTVTEVNPAYTSQTCSGCGFTHKTNRSGTRFRCRHCNKTSHADVNAARNIRSRRSWSQAQQYRHRGTILGELDQKFTTRWGCEPGRITSRNPNPLGLVTPVQLGSADPHHLVQAASRENLAALPV